MNSRSDFNLEEGYTLEGEDVVHRLRAEHEAFLKASQTTVRDTTRLTRLFTILSEPAPLELMLDRVLSTLSEIFAADVVVLLDPAGSGSFKALAAMGLPEEMLHLPMSSDESGCVCLAMGGREPVVRSGVSEDPTVEAQWRELGVETAVWVPVLGSHDARGVLILARCHRTPFAQDDVALLSAMAYRIGLALEQAQRNVQLERVVQSGRRISRNLSELAVCSETVRMFPAVVGADAAALVLIDASGRSRWSVQSGSGQRWDGEWRQLTEHLLVSAHLDNFQPFNTSNLHAESEALSLPEKNALPVKALLAVPIRHGDRIQGVLYAVRHSAVAFNPETVQIARLFSAQTSAALENARLYETVEGELAERIRAERQLSESEERLQLALAGAALGMWDWNVTTGEVRFNDRWSQMLGYAPDEIEPHVRSWDRMIHPEDRPKVASTLDAHLKGRSAHFESEHRLLAKTGDWIWVLDKGKVTHRDAEGRPVRFVGTSLDITEAKQLQADRLLIVQQKHEAWRAESLGRMAGGVAHHFNNQLQVVIGSLEQAQDEIPPASSARSLIDDAMEASSKAAEVSQLMLAYLGQKKGKAEPIDLLQAVRGVLPLLLTSVPKNVRVKACLPPQGPVIMADGVQIKQILASLVSNAVEAIGECDGEITISVGIPAPEELQHCKVFPLDWDRSPSSCACVSISDTGCGMDAMTQERIFEPFFTTKFTGRGLGMPVTLGIVRSYGGAIAVESEPGRGTSLRLFFPVSRQSVGASHGTDTPVALRFQGTGQVLVVDDEPMVRALAQAQLQALGYEVIVACDGVDAVEKFKTGKDSIKLVLLDLSMPRMDGWETLDALRALRPEVRVIIASGYTEAQAMQGLHRERPQAFLHKPYKAADLQAALESTLEEPSESRQDYAVYDRIEGPECRLGPASIE